MAYPKIEWVCEPGLYQVRMNGCPIVEFSDTEEKGLTFSFVPTAGDERRIGHSTRKDKRCSLGWGVQDSRLVGYKSGSLDFENHPEEGWFLVTARGTKPDLSH